MFKELSLCVCTPAMYHNIITINNHNIFYTLIIMLQLLYYAVAGSWSPWLKGSCSTLPCGGVGVRTDVRLCTSPTPSDGRVHCKGEQWRNTSCFACPCTL